MGGKNARPPPNTHTSTVYPLLRNKNKKKQLTSPFIASPLHLCI
jgi:hypothetical protein